MLFKNCISPKHDQKNVIPAALNKFVAKEGNQFPTADPYQDRALTIKMSERNNTSCTKCIHGSLRVIVNSETESIATQEAMRKNEINLRTDQSQLNPFLLIESNLYKDSRYIKPIERLSSEGLMINSSQEGNDNLPDPMSNLLRNYDDSKSKIGRNYMENWVIRNYTNDLTGYNRERFLRQINLKWLFNPDSRRNEHENNIKFNFGLSQGIDKQSQIKSVFLNALRRWKVENKEISNNCREKINPVCALSLFNNYHPVLQLWDKRMIKNDTVKLDNNFKFSQSLCFLYELLCLWMCRPVTNPPCSCSHGPIYDCLNHDTPVKVLDNDNDSCHDIITVDPNNCTGSDVTTTSSATVTNGSALSCISIPSPTSTPFGHSLVGSTHNMTTSTNSTMKNDLPAISFSSTSRNSTMKTDLPTTSLLVTNSTASGTSKSSGPPLNLSTTTGLPDTTTSFLTSTSLPTKPDEENLWTWPKVHPTTLKGETIPYVTPFFYHKHTSERSNDIYVPEYEPTEYDRGCLYGMCGAVNFYPA